MERIAQSKGLTLKREDTEVEQNYNINLVESKKKFAVKCSINSIQRKYYAKFWEQRAILEAILKNHNNFMKEFTPNWTHEQRNNAELWLIDSDSLPMIIELDEIILELKNSLPVITNKLPWSSNKIFKSRAHTSDEYYFNS